MLQTLETNHLRRKRHEPIVLVTGAHGFVASHLIRSLGTTQVIGITRNPSGHGECREVILEQALQRDSARPPVNCIVHLASVTPWNTPQGPKDFGENVRYAESLLKIMARLGIERIVYVSTGGVYGYRGGAIKEDGEIASINEYSKSKLDVENLFKEGLKPEQLTLLRLFFPYGRGQKGGLVPSLLNTIRGLRPVPLNDDVGSPKINPIYIEDLVKILIYFIENKSHGVFNVAGPDIVSIRELADLIGEACGKQVSFEVIPSNVRNLIADTSKIENLVRLRRVGICEGLRKMLLAQQA